MSTTIRISFKLDGLTTARIIAAWQWYESPGQDLTRQKLEEICRDALHLNGTDRWPYVSEDYSDEEWAARWKWAVLQLAGHWPSMAKDIPTGT